MQFFRWGFCRYGNGIGPDCSFFRLRKRLRLLFARIIPNPFPKYKSPLGAPKMFFSVKWDSAARSSRAAEKRFFAIPVSRTAGIRDAEIVENVIDQKEKTSLPAAIGKKEKKTNHMQQKALDRTREAAVSYSRKRFHYLQGVKKKKGSENIVRLKDVAEACGVSVATVSRALNGLSDENKEKTFFICQTARDMGYYPNAAARTLKTSRSNNIGILYEDRMNHEYFSSLIDALRKCAEERGYDLTFIRRSEETTRDSYYEHAQRRNLDGVIVLQADFDSAGVIRLATSNIPTVIVDHVYEGCDCVSSDNRASMEQIVHRVREAGHQRVALIQGQRGAVSQERLAGFYKGCAENGIRVPVNYVVESRFHDPDSCALEIKKLLALPEKPTCILCPDDYSCLGALWMLREEGICVPENVSLIGYDGIRMARLMHPRPTTYCQDYEAIAREVVKLILEGIEEPDTHVRRQITVPGKLLEGDTLGAPAAD